MICELDDEWKERAFLTAEEIKLYLDPANLPREFLKGHAQRSLRDV